MSEDVSNLGPAAGGETLAGNPLRALRQRHPSGASTAREEGARSFVPRSSRGLPGPSISRRRCSLQVGMDIRQLLQRYQTYTQFTPQLERTPSARLTSIARKILRCLFPTTPGQWNLRPGIARSPSTAAGAEQCPAAGKQKRERDPNDGRRPLMASGPLFGVLWGCWGCSVAVAPLPGGSGGHPRRSCTDSEKPPVRKLSTEMKFLKRALHFERLPYPFCFLPSDGASEASVSLFQSQGSK